MRAFLFSLLLLPFVFAGCGSDNSYNGKDGLITSSGLVALEGINTLYQNSSGELVTASTALAAALDDLESNTTLDNLQSAQSAFAVMLKEWKKVQAIYIAGDLDESMIDEPNYIDFFHNITEDITVHTVQLDTIIAGSTALSAAMYKNSHRSINALEYLLFGRDHDNAALLAAMQSNVRRIQACAVAGDSLHSHFVTIRNYYASSRAFVDGGTESVEYLINILIDSAYKLKEWRVGDPGGFTNKYKGNPDASRLEYVNSALSLEAIVAILQMHEALMESGLFDIATDGGAADEATDVETDIAAALAACDAFGTSMADDVAGDAMQNLYTAMAALYNAYYLDLINALSLTTEIIEADGD